MCLRSDTISLLPAYKKNQGTTFPSFNLFLLRSASQPVKTMHTIDCAWTTCHVPQPQLNARDVPFLTRMVEDKQHRYKTNVFYQDGNQLQCKAMEMAVNVFATCMEVYVTEWFSDKHEHLQMRCQQNKRVITAVTTAQVRDKSCV